MGCPAGGSAHLVMFKQYNSHIICYPVLKVILTVSDLIDYDMSNREIERDNNGLSIMMGRSYLSISVNISIIIW